MIELDSMFQRQSDFLDVVLQKNYNKKLSEFSSEEKQKLTKEYITSLIGEAIEVLNCVNHKTHRSEDKIVDINNISEELIDTFKYILCLMIIWGFDSKKIVESFNEKSEVVELRFKQEMLLDHFKGNNVLVVDIDGVLNYWPEVFVRFANSLCYSLDKNKTHYDLYFHDINGATWIEVKNWEEFCKLPAQLQDDIKHMYRTSGYKRTQEPNDNMRKFLEYVKENTDLKILILSSRPYDKYYRIFSDTKFWLDNVAKIPYDGIYFDTKKHRSLLKNIDGIKMFIDDDIDFIENAASQGIPSTLFINQNIKSSYYDKKDASKYQIFDPSSDDYQKLYSILNEAIK